MGVKTMFSLVIMAALFGLPLWAQDEGDRKARETVEEDAAREPTDVAPGDEGAGKLLRAIRLPEAAEQAREEGVPAEEVKKVLEAARVRDLPAGETEAIMVEETQAVREKGQIDDFGSFVKSKLDEGLRGRELSDAIRAEHAARGKGRDQGKPDKAATKGDRKGRHEDDVVDREGAARGKKMKPEKTDGPRGKKNREKNPAENDD